MRYKLKVLFDIFYYYFYNMVKDNIILSICTIAFIGWMYYAVTNYSVSIGMTKSQIIKAMNREPEAIKIVEGKEVWYYTLEKGPHAPILKKIAIVFRDSVAIDIK